MTDLEQHLRSKSSSKKKEKKRPRPLSSSESESDSEGQQLKTEIVVDVPAALTHRDQTVAGPSRNASVPETIDLASDSDEEIQVPKKKPQFSIVVVKKEDLPAPVEDSIRKKAEPAAKQVTQRPSASSKVSKSRRASSPNVAKPLNKGPQQTPEKRNSKPSVIADGDGIAKNPREKAVTSAGTSNLPDLEEVTTKIKENNKIKKALPTEAKNLKPHEEGRRFKHATGPAPPHKDDRPTLESQRAAAREQQKRRGNTAHRGRKSGPSTRDKLKKDYSLEGVPRAQKMCYKKTTTHSSTSNGVPAAKSSKETASARPPSRSAAADPSTLRPSVPPANNKVIFLIILCSRMSNNYFFFHSFR